MHFNAKRNNFVCRSTIPAAATGIVGTSVRVEGGTRV